MKKFILTVLFVISMVTISYAEHFKVVGGKFNFDVEKLYLEVCSVLNVTPRDYQYTIILDNSKSRCIPEKKIIYLGIYTKRVLAHEMAHLCIAERFWAEPNEKIAELIAQYAEFEISK